jgi:hypothetical protein
MHLQLKLDGEMLQTTIIIQSKTSPNPLSFEMNFGTTYLAALWQKIA